MALFCECGKLLLLNLPLTSCRFGCNTTICFSCGLLWHISDGGKLEKNHRNKCESYNDNAQKVSDIWYIVREGKQHPKAEFHTINSSQDITRSFCGDSADKIMNCIFNNPSLFILAQDESKNKNETRYLITPKFPFISVLMLWVGCVPDSSEYYYSDKLCFCAKKTEWTKQNPYKYEWHIWPKVSQKTLSINSELRECIQKLKGEKADVTMATKKWGQEFANAANEEDIIRLAGLMFSDGIFTQWESNNE